MDESATARAQTDHALEQAALALKRTIGMNRRVLQVVQRARAERLGINIETQPGGTVASEDDVTDA